MPTIVNYGNGAQTVFPVPGHVRRAVFVGGVLVTPTATTQQSVTVAPAPGVGVPVEVDYEIYDVQTGITLSGGSDPTIFLPPTDDYAGIMSARAAAIAAGGGTVLLKPITYPSFGNQSIPVVSGVGYVGTRPTFTSPLSGAPDIGTLLGAGTVLEADPNTIIFAGRVEPGLEFTGTILNSVLTVATAAIGAETGIVGFLDAGSNIRQDGVIGTNIFIVAQLTSTEPGGVLGKRGTYSLVSPAGNNITNPPALTAANTWRCEYVSGITIQNIAFKNCFSAIKIGAFGTIGATFSTFKNLFAYNTAAESFALFNYQQITCEDIFSFSCGHGPSFAMWAPFGNGGIGNASFNNIYNYQSNNPLARGLILGTVPSSPGAGPGIMYYKRIQSNHYGRPAVDIAATVTNADPWVTVPALAMAGLPLGMPVRLSASLGGFTGGAVGSSTRPAYFVVARDTGTNKVKLSISPSGVPLTPNAGGAVSLRRYGMPDVVISGGLMSSSQAEADGLSLDGDNAMLLIARMSSSLIAYISMSSDLDQSVTVRACSSMHFINTANTRYDFDLTSGTSSISMSGGGAVIPANSIVQGGSSPVGVFREVATGLGLSLSNNRVGGAAGLPTLYSKEPGNGPVACFGSPVAYLQGYATSVSSNVNNGSFSCANGTFTGTAPAVWTFTSGNSVGMKGFRQAFKNSSKTPGATLTITLGVSSGTFDGLTGGASLGKSIVLQPPSGSTPGGSLVLMCMEVGVGVYEWSVESLINGSVL